MNGDQAMGKGHGDDFGGNGRGGRSGGGRAIGRGRLGALIYCELGELVVSEGPIRKCQAGVVLAAQCHKNFLRRHARLPVAPRNQELFLLL